MALAKRCTAGPGSRRRGVLGDPGSAARRTLPPGPRYACTGRRSLQCTPKIHLIAVIRNYYHNAPFFGCILIAMLTLRQLRYLEALARHGHFGRAAEECAVSQPALSMQIRELERELGVELLERRQGITVLTEVGAEVARRTTYILSATRDLADCARHGGCVLSGKLRFGVIPTLAPYVLPPRFTGAAPAASGGTARAARDADQDAAARAAAGSARRDPAGAADRQARARDVAAVR